MAKPTLWLGLVTLVVSVTIVILIALLYLGVFNQIIIPLDTSFFVPTPTGPWSLYKRVPGTICQTYKLGKLGTNEPPGEVINPNPSCTATNQVAAILTQRTCESEVCIDSTGVERPKGYLESIYQDCSLPYSCSGKNCFNTLSYCPDKNIATVQLQTNSFCIVPTIPVNGATETVSVIPVTCDGTVNQQWNFIPVSTVPLGTIYQIRNSTGGRCLVPNSNNTVVVGPCIGDSGWFLSPNQTVVVNGVQVLVPQQLIWIPIISKIRGSGITYPTTVEDLTAFSKEYSALVGIKLVRGYEPFCSDNTSTGLKRCLQNTFLPTAIL